MRTGQSLLNRVICFYTSGALPPILNSQPILSLVLKFQVVHFYVYFPQSYAFH